MHIFQAFGLLYRKKKYSIIFENLTGACTECPCLEPALLQLLCFIKYITSSDRVSVVFPKGCGTKTIFNEAYRKIKIQKILLLTL